MDDLLDRGYRELIACAPEISIEAHELVDALIDRWGEEGLAEKVLNETPLDVPWEHTASVVSMMEWSTSDNGSRISRECEKWLLDALDERRVFVAMNRDVFPFMDSDQMNSVIENVGQVFPKQKKRCLQLISRLSAQSKRAEQG